MYILHHAFTLRGHWNYGVRYKGSLTISNTLYMHEITILSLASASTSLLQIQKSDVDFVSQSPYFQHKIYQST